MPINRIFLRPKTSIGGFTLDGVISEDHSESLVKTTHPIETGADITDHSYMNPSKLTIVGRVTDTPLISSANSLSDFVDNVQAAFGAFNTEGTGRSQRAWAQLRAMMSSGEPMLVTTNLRAYPDMAIVGLRNLQTNENPRALDVEISMEAFEFSTSETEFIQTPQPEEGKTANQAATTTNRGRQATPEPSATQSASWLKSIKNFAVGD